MANILIIDDNPDIAFMIQEKIRSALGGTLRIAANGEEGLQAINEQPPDLILLDIRMPGNDGFEVCRLLKASPATAAIPVIFLSATYNDLRSKIKGLDLGAEDFMVHPVDDLELVTRVKAILQIKELRDQLGALQQSQRHLLARQGELQERLATTCRTVLRFCQPGEDGPLALHELAQAATTQLAFAQEAASNDHGPSNEAR